jgi:hypothetical protein
MVNIPPIDRVHPAATNRYRTKGPMVGREQGIQQHGQVTLANTASFQIYGEQFDLGFNDQLSGVNMVC